MDYTIFMWLYNAGQHFPKWTIVFASEYLIYILILFFVWALLKNDRRLAVFGVISGAVGYVLATILKSAIHISRPFISQPITPIISESGGSFPSRHELTIAAVAFAVYPRHKKWGAALIVVSIVVGIARIMAGVHYPSDILGGLVLGALIGFLADKFFGDRIAP